MFQLYANKNQLAARRRETLTSGSINVYQVRFEFSPDWEGLERTAVFRAGTESRSVPLDDSGVCEIPWEVLASQGRRLSAGVYGTQGESLVLPTVWADLGAILEGAAPGEASRPPTPELWRQELDKKGDALDYDGQELHLKSGEKILSSVEIAGGGALPVPGPPGPAGSQGAPGEDGATFTPSVSEDGTLSWSNDKGLPNPEPVNIQGPPGELGGGSGGSGGPAEEIYSTEERRIGTWIDGKPLYRLSIETTVENPGTASAIMELPAEAEVKMFQGFAKRVDNGAIYSLPNTEPNDVGHNISCYIHNSKIMVWAGSGVATRLKKGKFWAIAEYTKTTDEAQEEV